MNALAGVRPAMSASCASTIATADAAPTPPAISASTEVFEAFHSEEGSRRSANPSSRVPRAQNICQMPAAPTQIGTHKCPRHRVPAGPQATPLAA